MVLRTSAVVSVLAVTAIVTGFFLTGGPSPIPPAGVDSDRRSVATSEPADYAIETLKFPSASNSGEPFLTASADGTVYASWLEKLGHGSTRLLFSVLREDAENWTSPLLIAQGDNWFVNWADVPSIAVGPDNRMVAHWLERMGSGRYAYGIRFSLSQDGGKSWSPPVWLHEDLSGTEHGFASLSFDSAGTVDAIWLDGRAMAKGEGRMSIIARRINPDGSLQKEFVVDEQTCECCPTAITRMESGSLLAAYRDRSDSHIREIAVSRMQQDSWSEPNFVSADAWRISACPVNGPAIDAFGSAVGVAWFSAPEDMAKVQMTFSDDGGRSFDLAVRVNEGRPVGRVGLQMLGENRAVVTWIEAAAPADTEAGIKMRIIHRDGTLEKPVIVAATSASRASGYPRVAGQGNRLVFLWTEVGSANERGTNRVVSAIARPTNQHE